MIYVFSCVVKYLIDRIKKSGTDDETSAEFISFVKVTSIMFVGKPSLMGSKHWCAGRRVRKGIVMVT